MALQAEIEFRD